CSATRGEHSTTLNRVKPWESRTPSIRNLSSSQGFLTGLMLTARAWSPCLSALVNRNLKTTHREKIMKISAILLFLVVMLAGLLSVAPFERDRPAEIDRAQESLKAARNELQHAGDEWRGHRAKAIKNIDAALRELEQAERFAREHHR